MIAIIKPDATEDQIYELTEWFEGQGLRCDLSRGDYQTIIGLVGDTSGIDPELVEALDIVESVTRITKPEDDQAIRSRAPGDFRRSGIKTVGVVGLGLIGGSYAKAFQDKSEARILGYDLSDSITSFAKLEGTLDDILTKDNIGECDLLIVALYNQAIIDFIKENAPYIKKDALVIDTGGLKRRICSECFPIASEYGFTFIGGHPMAGKKFSGYKYSTGKLFRDSSMIIVPDPKCRDIYTILHKVEDALAPCRFGSITVCSADKHDSMIAFTSEMAHIVSNAYIKSPTAREHNGFSAGSYKDMTRVAWLNEDMWTEIFMENKDNLIFELDTIIGFLEEYKNALETGDSEKMRTILRDGKQAKEELDGI
ncbi:MAG: prephenate dehydrogenase/arogenate dehydrogenase family protein [Eubacterium sp.]|nr:prephenate dehydrogenase/arogenate dehydrogenase family protein [Eubacterium sp.]